MAIERDLHGLPKPLGPLGQPCPTCNGSGVERCTDRYSEWQAPCSTCRPASPRIQQNEEDR